MNHSSVTFVAGKSGGHIIPGLTIAHTLKNTNSTTHIHFFTTNAVLDGHILSKATYVDTHRALPLGSIQLCSWWKYPWYLVQAAYSCMVILYDLLMHRPQRIISIGGLVSIPVVLIGWLLRIPTELYELNAIPGKAIMATAWFAQKIHVCFAATQSYFKTNRCVVSLYPIRFTQNTITTQQARNTAGLDAHLPTLLILGGSQGSLWINMIIKQWVIQTMPSNVQIIHQTGASDSTDWQAFYQQHSIKAHVFSFTSTIEMYYQSADLIFARAGAGTLFEIAHFNKRCIIVPLEATTTSHQVDNALAFAQDYPQLCTVVLQKEIEKNNLILFGHLTNQLHIDTGDDNKKNNNVITHVEHSSLSSN